MSLFVTCCRGWQQRTPSDRSFPRLVNVLFAFGSTRSGLCSVYPCVGGARDADLYRREVRLPESADDGVGTQALPRNLFSHSPGKSVVCLPIVHPPPLPPSTSRTHRWVYRGVEDLVLSLSLVVERGGGVDEA